MDYSRKDIYNKSNNKIRFTKDNKHKMIFAKNIQKFKMKVTENKSNITRCQLPRTNSHLSSHSFSVIFTTDQASPRGSKLFNTSL